MISTLGIVGKSPFADLLSKLFRLANPEVQIKFFSRRENPDQKTFFSFSEVVNSDLLLPVVPISAFEETIINISKNLSKSNTLLSVCSIMSHPKKIMLKYLPGNTKIITSHPNFGPESFSRNNNKFDGLNLVLENTRCKTEIFNYLLDNFSQIGLKVEILSSDFHDENIGNLHFLSLFVGTLVNDLNLDYPLNIPTSARKLKEFAELVKDNRQILKDVYNLNPFAKNMLEQIKLTINSLELEFNEK